MSAVTDEAPAAADSVREPGDAAARMARAADLGWLRATRIRAEDRDRSGQVVRGGQSKQQTVGVVVELRHSRKGDSPNVYYDVSFSVDSPAGGKVAASDIEVEFRLQVTVPRGMKLAEDELEAFGESVVVGTVYPFFREAYHSLTARLGRRPSTLGLLKTPLSHEKPW